MTTNDWLDAARKLLEQHNSSIASEEKIDIDGFFDKLAKMGGTSESALSNATWEDLEDCGIPRILARAVAKIFRNEVALQPQKVILDISNDPEKHAKLLTVMQLVDHYDPENHTNPYGVRLGAVTEGRKCLAFNKDGSLNRNITNELVHEIVNLRYPERESVVIDGVPSRVYRVGDRPDLFADENPVRHGTPLRPDGFSDAGFYWGGISPLIRQLVYIAVRLGEFKGDELDAFERVEGKSFSQVAQRYQKAALEFEAREKLGTLPQLKIRLGHSTSKQNPFGVNRVF